MKLGIAGNLTRTFIASPLTPLFLLAAFALGLVALITLPREEEPQILVPMVDVHVSADGLKAEDAAKLVTEPLETIVKSIAGVEHVYSHTEDDGVLLTARFQVGTNSDAAVLRVSEKIHANMDRIPVGIAEPLIVGRGIDDVAIVVVTLTPTQGAASRWTENDLTRLARELQVEVAKLPDIGRTYISGEQGEEIRVEPDPEKLSLYGITLAQLQAKIAGANRSFQVGLVRDNGEQRTLVAGQTLQTLTEIGNLLVTARDGRPVYVRDVANVRLVTEPNEARVTEIRKTGSGLDRVPAVSLAIAKRPGTNAVVIADAITERLEQVRGQIFPEDVEMTITRNYGESANEKANELLFHLGLATISIVVLVAIAIGWREAIVVAIVIPTTILLTLFASRIMGYTLNRVSLFALIFSIGILVDDAIVVIENIARHWAMKDGRPRAQAAIEAVAEVGNPTIVATLTVIAALLPMLFVSGMMGPYMSPIPANASAAMLFSFFVAVILTPWLMMRFGRKGNDGGHAHGHDAGQGGWLGRAYAAVARPVLKTRARSWTFLLIVGAATIASLGLIYTQHVTVKLLPFDNKTELQIVVDLPPGSSVEATDRTLQQIVDRLGAVPEVVSFQSYAGTNSPFNFNGLVRQYYMRSSPNQGDVVVNLTPKGDRVRASHAIAVDLREKLKGLDLPAGTAIKVVEPPPGPPVLGTLLAEIYGPDPDTRRAVATKVREIFASIPFIVDVDDSFHTQPTRLRMAIDQDNLEYYKVEQSDAYDAINALYGGTTVGYSHRGGGRQPIPIRLALSKSDGVVDERGLAVPVPADALPGGRGVVELGDIVKVTREPASFPIFRHNGRAAEMVTAELAGAFEAPVYGMIAVSDAIDKADWGNLPKPVIALHGQPDDESHPTLLWDGEWEVTWVTFRDMGAAFGVAILGIYILVVAQFGSFRLPLVVLTPIPLTFIGIMIGHWIFGAPFSATSMIGFIALAGIIVRNSILLIDFIRHAQTPDRPRIDVLIEAGSIRFKPILLTALAAMIGAAVILTDPIFQGLAISLLFGLASSTALTVLVIPAIYVALRGPGVPKRKTEV
ncbi:multidrug transporter AcrB [Kaistia algarum]|uniref:efflux RND transporter permease subunit n=1 Tax=Kaistia algarum TaxID=2083279 RepID=UPI000CE75334|nr:efflux RND transporter permease subunit [Kaistia algarum]MCX5513911.1 efflux RND transporter permease subunit [Kaistia algarum]PPE77543.1 multidrug transporter AcrB [Kaistia algarum]